MNKVCRKIASITLAFVMALSFSACGGASNSLPGTGTAGVVEKIDWSGYDELIDRSIYETDPVKRAHLLHAAEDMLIDTGAIAPITSAMEYMLVKPDITGVEMKNNANLDFTHIEKTGGNPESSISVCACSEVTKLDPPANTTHDMGVIAQNIYARLMTKSADGIISPELAESYTVSDDGMTYTFAMRDGLKWSDGSDLNAIDFEYSWKRAAASENAFEYGNMFDCISGYPDDLDVTASDDGRILTVKLISPTAYFIELCCNAPYSPVQKKQVEEAPGFKDASGKLLNPSAWAADGPVVTNGAYFVDEWIHNERITLKKNPYYYDADNVKTETVIMMLTSDNASAYSAYLSDSVAVLNGKIPNDVLTALKDNPEFHLYPKNNSSSIMFNVSSPLFAGMTKEEAATFRKAIRWAIDSQFIVDVANPGATTTCGTYVPMGMSDGSGKRFSETEGYAYPLESGYYPPYPDLDKAREMLKSIGFEFGDDGKLKQPITIEYLYASSPTNEAVAVALQADLAQLGINLSISSREWAVFLGEELNGNYEMAITGWNADFDDPYNFLSLYTTDSPNNRAFLGR